MSLTCQGSVRCHLFMNNLSVWQNDLNYLRDLGQHVLVQSAPESRGMCWGLHYVLLDSSLPRLVQLTQSSAFNQLSNPGLECQGVLFTPAAIMPPSSCYCLHCRNHTQSAKCLFVHERESNVGVFAAPGEGAEGVKYLTWGNDKIHRRKTMSCLAVRD